MKPLSRKRRSTYFFGFLILFLIFIPLITFYAIGYRFVISKGVIETGGIFVKLDQSNVIVSLDGTPVEQTGFFSKDYFIQNLAPGTSTVTVAESGYQTWKKVLAIQPALVTEADPFLLPTTPVTRPILPYVDTDLGTTTATKTASTTPNPEYQAVVALFATTTSPNSPIPLLSPTATSSTEKVQGQISIYEAGSNLHAFWNGASSDNAPFYFCQGDTCENDLLIFKSSKAPAYFDFFPGRSDLVVIATSTGVYVTELDTRTPQNVESLYPVSGATFRIGQGGTIYIKDKTKYFAISV